MKVFSNPSVWVSDRPYSPAVAVGGLLHLSGHVPVDETGRTSGVDGRQQAERILDNLERTLTSAGASLRDVVSTTVYLTDIADIDAIDDVYRSVFGKGPYPSRTTVQIASLARPNFRVEISAVARLDEGHSLA